MSGRWRLSDGGALPALTSGLQLDVGPFVVRIRSEVPGVAEHLKTHYADFPIGDGDGGHFNVAIVSGGGVRRWVRPQALLSVNGARPFLPVPAHLGGPVLEWGLNYCIGTRAHRLVSVHAAVVERGGRALILSAPSGSGKSTLCAALAYGGWRLFSDEFALIDPAAGALRPAPRPIALKEAAIDVIRQRHPDVPFTPEMRDTEGLRFVHARPPRDSVHRAQEPAAPGWIVFPRYTPNQPTVIERVTKAQALMELAGQSFNYNYLQDGFEALAGLVGASECFALAYSELDDVVARLAQLV